MKRMGALAIGDEMSAVAEDVSGEETGRWARGQNRRKKK